MSDRRTSPAPWRVGLLALAALVVLVGVLVMVGPLRLYDGVPLEVDFAYAGPIKPGAAVRLSGVVVGAVERVELLAGTDEAAGPEVMVRVHARVEDRAMPAITPETRFYVTTLGVLGEHYLELVPGSPRSAPLSRGSRVRGIDLARSDLLLPRAAALLEVMTAILDEGREDAVGLLRQAGSLLARFEAMLGEDGGTPLWEEGRALVVEARGLMAAMRPLLADDGELIATLREFRTLGRGLDDAGIAQLVARGHLTVEEVSGAIGLLERMPLASTSAQDALLRKLETSLARFDDVARRADTVLGALERGEGGAGRAFQDEALIDDLKAVLRQLRRNPMRLLLRGDNEDDVASP